jgi:hypothetical protein
MTGLNTEQKVVGREQDNRERGERERQSVAADERWSR